MPPRRRQVASLACQSPTRRSCEPAGASRSSRVPVWFMRQAGRSLPEYRAARGDGSDPRRHPPARARRRADPAAGAPLRRRRRHPLLRHRGAGRRHRLRRRRRAGPGPGGRPARSGRPSDLARLRPLEPEADTGYVARDRPPRHRRSSTPLGIPLIGFAGAPFTVASYLVEGGPVARLRPHQGAHARRPGALWPRLLDALADMAVASLRAQVRGRRVRRPALRQLGRGALPRRLRAHRPARHAARSSPGWPTSACRASTSASGTGELLALMATAGADVVGVDWRVPLDEARRRVGTGLAVQGNLDPTRAWRRGTSSRPRPATCSPRGGGTGHVFNLGHGVLPETDPDVLARDRRRSCTPTVPAGVVRPCGSAGDARRRARHGPRHAPLARRARRLLHRDPPRQPAARRAARRSRAALRGHRGDVAAQRAHRGAGRRDPRALERAGAGPLRRGRRAPSSPPRASRTPSSASGAAGVGRRRSGSCSPPTSRRPAWASTPGGPGTRPTAPAPATAGPSTSR